MEVGKGHIIQYLKKRWNFIASSTVTKLTYQNSPTYIWPLRKRICLPHTLTHFVLQLPKILPWWGQQDIILHFFCLLLASKLHNNLLSGPSIRFCRSFHSILVRVAHIFLAPAPFPSTIISDFVTSTQGYNNSDLLHHFRFSFRQENFKFYCWIYQWSYK